MESPKPPQQSKRWLLKQCVLWFLTLGLLAYLFVAIPFESVWTALERVPAFGYVALMVGLVVTTLATDSLSYWMALREVSPDSRLRVLSVMELRASSHLLGILNSAVGQGGLIYLLRRHHGVSVLDGFGVVVLTISANLLVLCGMVGAGMATGVIPDDPTVRWVAIAILIAAPLHLTIVALKPAFAQRIGLMRPLLKAGARGALRLVAIRGVHVLIWVLGHWLILELFGLEITFPETLIRVPLLFLVAAIPLTPAGLGTTQAVAVFLFSDFVVGGTELERKATVLAYSLSTHALAILLHALLAVPFARKFVTSPTTSPV